MKLFRKLSYVVATALILQATPTLADPPKVLPTSPQQVTLSYAPLVKKVTPAVVNIYTRKLVKQRLSPLFSDPFFQQFFGGNLPQGMTRQRMESSLGSGVIIRPDGMVVTNNHVIAGADQITVVLADRREFEATLVTTDERTDLAVLKLTTKGETFPALDLKDSDTAEVGDLVLAIGNPFGVGQTVTNGIISALARSSLDINDINYFIQTDAPINPGNSGGALVTMDGKLVGINSAIFTRDGGNMGIGFAIPSNMVRTVTEAVASGRKNIVRPWTGIEGQEITGEVAASLNLTNPTGLLIKSLHPAGPAAKAGLKRGDVITAINGKTIEDPAAFRYRIATMAVGADAAVEVIREGKKQTLTMKLIAPPEDPPREETKVKGTNPLSGATIANLSPAVAEELSFRSIDKGVVVLKVAEEGPAAGLGFQPGDILQTINGAEVTNVKEALSALQKTAPRWKLTIRRGDRVINLIVNK